MDRKMLINAAHAEECRIAIVEDGELVELEVESLLGRKLKGNIYKARISRIEPSLQAAFIDLGTERNGFLQINDVHPAYFRNTNRRQRLLPTNTRINEVLEPGQELIVQVVKEEREAKGATLTTFISLPGRYIVLMPGSDRGGISRRISDSEQRHRLKALAKELEMPVGVGMIVRTAGLNRSQSDLARDLSLQIKLWEKILAEAQTKSAPSLLYKESDLATRVIRDYFTPEIREILIDEPTTYNKVREFVGEVMPRYRSRVRLYEGDQPIFSAVDIETQVAGTLTDEVKLPSGGAIVIDMLEALVAIDVNSGKATAGTNIEETAFRTNLEAADEIARQLRLRDLGGLIVIDFIDMVDRRHKAQLERRMKDALVSDKARVELGRLSRFGLMEMSRQRLRGSLASQSHLPCQHCRGTGRVKNNELVALEVFRKIQSAVAAGKLAMVKGRLSPGPALFLLNNKKVKLAEIETKHSCEVYILADGRLRNDEYELELVHQQVGASPRPVIETEQSQNTRVRKLEEDEEDEDDFIERGSLAEHSEEDESSGGEEDAKGTRAEDPVGEAETPA